MALVLKDRVKETTTTAGTGTVTLLGAAPGFQSFAVVGNANTTYYTIAGQTTSEWEVGIGTYTSSGTTLARTTVLSNSSGTEPSALSFSAGTKDVFVTYPSGKSVNLDASGNATALGTPVAFVGTNMTGLPLTTGVTGALPAANGGTGVANNAAMTVTGSGNFAYTRTLTGTTNVTFPTTGTLGTLAGTETLTNKTVEAGTFTNGYTEEVFTANSSTAITLDLANGTVQIITLTGNCTYTFPTPVAGKSFILIHLQDATGGRQVTWPATVDWPGPTQPTLTTTPLRADKFVFTAISGTSWLGSVAGQDYTV